MPTGATTGEPLRLPYAQRMDYAMGQLAAIGHARAGQLYVFLCQKAKQETGESFWGKAKLGEQFGIGERQVYNLVRLLEWKGYVHVRTQPRDGRGRFGRTIYTVLDPTGGSGLPTAADDRRQGTASPSATHSSTVGNALQASVGNDVPSNRHKEPTPRTDTSTNRGASSDNEGPSRSGSPKGADPPAWLASHTSKPDTKRPTGKGLPTVRRRPGTETTGERILRLLEQDDSKHTVDTVMLRSHYTERSTLEADFLDIVRRLADTNIEDAALREQVMKVCQSAG
jgi:hypothetical protein